LLSWRRSSIAALSHFLISNLTGKDCLSTFSLGQKLFRYVSHY
jgi:hypothetical protein